MSECTDKKKCYRRSVRKEQWLNDHLYLAEKLLTHFRDHLSLGNATLVDAHHAGRRKVDRMYSQRDIRSAILEGWACDYAIFQGEEPMVKIMSFVRVGPKQYRPIHIVCRVINDMYWKIITVMDPAERPWKWDDNFQKQVCFCGNSSEEYNY